MDLNAVNTNIANDVAGAMGMSEHQRADYTAWYKEASSKLLDLNASDADILSYINQQYQGQNSSPAKRQAIQQLMDTRTRTESALTQILRMMSETARQVIANIR